VIPLDITPDMMLDHVKWCAKWWGYVASNTEPEPETIEQARLLFPVSQDSVATANADLESIIARLQSLTEQRKSMEEAEEQHKLAVMRFMANRDVLSAVDGSVLATWKSAKGSKKFDATAFREAYPQMYDQFVREVPGSRRFLIK
jgi:hypothetical protein